MKVVKAVASIDKLTLHGKRLTALSMWEKGKAFIAAAILLRGKGGYEYVVLHLLCQGIEVLGKGYLLLSDYHTYEPQLRGIGHNLNKLVNKIEAASNLTILTEKLKSEFDELNTLYSKHLLRYGTSFDILHDPKNINSKRILRRLAAILRLVEKSGFISRK